MSEIPLCVVHGHDQDDGVSGRNNQPVLVLICILIYAVPIYVV